MRWSLSEIHSVGDEVEVSIENASKHYLEFLLKCYVGEGDFKFTPNSEVSDYARCFAIFGFHLIRKLSVIEDDKDVIREKIIAALLKKRGEYGSIPKGKAYRQLLAFSLSALSILDDLNNVAVSRLVDEQNSLRMREELDASGVFRGVAGTGNLAMFRAIFYLHGDKYQGQNYDSELEQWKEMHLESMNKYGFWGDDTSMSHLLFQNGYHQHEIFEYMGIENPIQDQTIESVLALADPDGRFAPYPGGGGCYDYDAAFMVTQGERRSKSAEVMLKLASSILNNQNDDGGFCESKFVRPRSLTNFSKGALHWMRASGIARKERLRQWLTLLRPKHDRVHTHWTVYSRQWYESDLWDSWFRMLTVARIMCYLDPMQESHWGFINYPGIGYHHCLRGNE